MTNEEHDKLLKLQEDAATFIASMTGIKAQFVASGWTADAAEQMTVELFRKVTQAVEAEQK